MTAPDLHALAEHGALTQQEIDETLAGADATWARNLTTRDEYERRASILKRMRSSLLTSCEAERAAAVAEALERVAERAERYVGPCKETVKELVEYARSLKPRSDLVCVQKSVLQYVLDDDGLVPRATSECRRVVREALAAAEGKPEGAFIAKDGKTPIEISVGDYGMEAERYKP